MTITHSFFGNARIFQQQAFLFQSASQISERVMLVPIFLAPGEPLRRAISRDIVLVQQAYAIDEEKVLQLIG